ncbi:MAG: hypothetical protein ACYSUS_06545 [Planctomycetota bacterium]
MKRNFYFNLAIFLCLAVLTNCFADTADLSEPMKQSLVYLEVSSSSYDLSQPWKQTPISKKSGYGCAVGPYEVLTIAENAQASFRQSVTVRMNTSRPLLRSWTTSTIFACWNSIKTR